MSNVDPAARGPRPVDRRGRPLRDLRISVTDRCNLRCPHCMPEEHYGADHPYLAPSECLDFEETARLARLFVALGVRKVRLTGGEPLLREGLPDLVARLRALPLDDLALTTNGLLLPRLARPLREAGLGRVTVSLDALDDGTLARMSGRPVRAAQVLRGIEAATEAGFPPAKINCVVRRGVNEHAALELVERFRGTGHVVRFIEYMDVGTRNGWEPVHVVPAAELLERIAARYSLSPRKLDPMGAVAEEYAFDDGQGAVGFIASVSRPFCGGCTRARLSGDGRLYACLFAATGLDLRGPLRDGADDAALAALVRGAWEQRADQYSEDRSGPGARADKVEMFRIGG